MMGGGRLPAAIDAKGRPAAIRVSREAMANPVWRRYIEENIKLFTMYVKTLPGNDLQRDGRCARRAQTRYIRANERRVGCRPRKALLDRGN
jgi:hypothetical protein